MHISNIQSLTPKSQNDTLGCPLEEIARHIGKSLSTVKRITPSLIERGFLARENGKRNGRWVVKYLADSPFCGREYKNDRSLRYEVSSDIWLQT